MSLNVQLLRDMLTQDTNAVKQLKELLIKERELLEQRKIIYSATSLLPPNSANKCYVMPACQPIYQAGILF